MGNASPYQKGRLCVKRGNYDTAAMHFRTAVMEDPERIDARLELASLQVNQFKHYNEARKHLEAVLHRQPDNEQALMLLAVALADSAREIDANDRDQICHAFDAVLGPRAGNRRSGAHGKLQTSYARILINKFQEYEKARH